MFRDSEPAYLGHQEILFFRFIKPVRGQPNDVVQETITVLEQLNGGVPLGTKASCPKSFFRDNENSVKLIGGFWEKAVFFSPCDTTAGLQRSSAGRSRMTAVFAINEKAVTCGDVSSAALPC